LRRMAGAVAGGGRDRGRGAGDRRAPGRRPDPRHLAAGVQLEDGACRGAAVPEPLLPGHRGRRAARPAAAELRAPVAGLLQQACRQRGARPHARGDRARPPPRPAGDRPAGGGSAGGGDAVDERHRLHPGQPGAAGRRRTRLRLPPLGAVMTRSLARTRPSALMLRWLALGAACGAAVMLMLDFFGLAGPWQGIALVLALLAAFAISATTFFMQNYDREIEDAEELVRRSEAEREELRQQIERQAQLEQQLRHAKRTAEAAVMAKGEFLATMSHEIRTPLNGIVPMLDLLMHARLAPDHAELVRTAHTSSQHLLRIVDDILDYSKLEADKLELES